MYPFIFLIVIPLLIRHTKIGPLKKQNANENAIKIFFCFLFLILALRSDSVGKDLPAYKHMYNSIRQLEWSELRTYSFEIGYIILNKLVYRYYDDFQMVLVVCAGISIYFIGKNYLRHCVDSSLTIALFISMSTFIMLFSGLRQSIAIALGLQAFEYTRTKKCFHFIITVCLAMSFHTSAFILFIMYPIFHFRISKRSLMWLIPLLSLLFIFNDRVFNILTVILSLFTSYDSTVTQTGAYTMIILLTLFVGFSFIIPDERKIDEDIIGMRNLLLLSLIIQFFAPLHVLAMRMNYYYLVFIPLLIPRIIKARRKRWNQVAIVARYIMIVFFMAYFIIYAPRSNSLDVFPYHFYWEK